MGEFTTKTKSTLMQFMIKNKIGLKQISAHCYNKLDKGLNFDENKMK